VTSIPRRLSAVLASAALVVAVTAVIALLEPGIPALGLGVLYLFAVVPVALRYGLVAALGTSLASMAVYDFWFLGRSGGARGGGARRERGGGAFTARRAALCATCR
jgi:K+-sensing histidine kinase KdpD